MHLHGTIAPMGVNTYYEIFEASAYIYNLNYVYAVS